MVHAEADQGSPFFLADSLRHPEKLSLILLFPVISPGALLPDTAAGTGLPGSPRMVFHRPGPVADISHRLSG